MSTTITIPIATVKTKGRLPSKTYALDFNTGHIVGYIDGLDAVEQAIHKALITPRFKCLVYSSRYGSEIERSIIADSASLEYIEAELPRLVEDALKNDGRILSIYGFTYEYVDDGVYISFSADTICGTTVIEEVI